MTQLVLIAGIAEIVAAVGLLVIGLLMVKYQAAEEREIISCYTLLEAKERRLVVAAKKLNRDLEKAKNLTEIDHITVRPRGAYEIKFPNKEI